ncbi:hypothetical protein ACFL6W_01155 [Thermodesulfobacteriota bacterium]
MVIKNINISPEMTVLDIVSIKKETIGIFNSYDGPAGECICCRSLFETLEKISKKYHINLETIINDLNNA